MDKNRLYCDDNLEILATMEKNIDLIYIDPPFFSRVECATCLHTRNHLMKEIEQKSKKQRELLIQKKTVGISR